MSGNFPVSGVLNLSTVLKRLEAATSRLEDISLSSAGAANLQLQGLHHQQPQSTLPFITNQPPVLAADAAQSSREPISPGAQERQYPNTQQVLENNAQKEAKPVAREVVFAESVLVFDLWLRESLQPWVDSSVALSPDLAQLSKLVQDLWTDERAVIVQASLCRKPKTALSLAHLLEDVKKCMAEINEFKDSNRKSTEYNHISFVTEGIAAAGWVALESKPTSYIDEMINSSQYYSNRVLQQWKSHADGKPHVEWVKLFTNALHDLKSYVSNFFPAGLEWNDKGSDPLTWKMPEELRAITSPSPGSKNFSGAPLLPSPSQSETQGFDPLSIFAELNQGTSITSSLKKVNKSEMTHKNPELRTSSVVPAVIKSSVLPPARPAKPAALISSPSTPVASSVPVKKTPKKELMGKKWTVENFENDSSIIIDITDMSQHVEIFSCKSCTVQIKGRAKSVSLLSSPKTSVLVDSLISSLSINSSNAFVAQVLGRVSSILIDNLDGGQVYLSKESLDAEIVTSKTSSLNISLPNEVEGDFAERAVPEQLISTVEGGKLVTKIFEHKG